MSITGTKIAVLGARGMLGSDLMMRLREQGYDPCGWHRPQWDITDYRDLRQAVESADVIINCAAYTHVDGAETESDRARLVNAEAVGELGRLAAATDKYIIHISTDFVYDGGKNGLYNEDDSPNPINVYGKTKYEGELLLTKSQCRCCILRVEWTYGVHGVSFITKLMNIAKKMDTIKVVNDQWGSPTATIDAADAICDVIIKQPRGIFLYAAGSYASRFEIAQCIISKLNLDAALIPAKTADFPAPAQRPLNSKFNCEKIDGILSKKRQDWRESLHRFLDKADSA